MAHWFPREGGTRISCKATHRGAVRHCTSGSWIGGCQRIPDVRILDRRTCDEPISVALCSHCFQPSPSRLARLTLSRSCVGGHFKRRADTVCNGCPCPQACLSIDR